MSNERNLDAEQAVAGLLSSCRQTKRRIERLSLALVGALIATFAGGFAHYAPIVGGSGSPAMLVQAYEERGVEGSLAALEGEIAAIRAQGEAPPANTLAEYAQLRAEKLSHERRLSEWASPSDSVAALGYSIPRAALFAGGWLLILGLSMFRNGAVSVLRRYWGELQKLERAEHDAAIRALYLLRTEFDEIGWSQQRGRQLAPRERWIRTFMKPTDWASLFLAYGAVASTVWALITAWRAGLQPDYAAAAMIGVPGLLGLLLYRFSLGRYARFKQMRGSRRRRLSAARVG